MKTGNWAILCVLFIVVGCNSSASKNETRADSTIVQPVSTSDTSSPSSPPQVNNFPEYSSELLTDDPLEAEVTAGIDELIAANNNLNFLTFQSYYLREREYEGEYDKVIEKEEVTETWFFDLSFKLRAYSKIYYRDGEGRNTKTMIHLFSNDTLVAMTERWDLDNQIGMTHYSKILASKCPKCGVDVSREAGGSGEVKGYTKVFEGYTTNFSELTGEREEEWKNARESDGTFVIKENIEQWPDGEAGGKPYVIERSMSRDLYSYFQSTKMNE